MFGEDMFQEAYNPGNSGYTDPFGDKITGYQPENIVSAGNNALKSGMFDMDVEDSSLALGYKNNGPATTPKPGSFMNPDD